MKPALPAVLAVALLAPAAAGAATVATPTTVGVTATDTSLRVGPTSVPLGTVVFRIRNAGRRTHDFEIAGRRTGTIKPGRTVTLTVPFRTAQRYAYATILHARPGMRGWLVVEAKPVVPPPDQGSPNPVMDPVSGGSMMG